MLKRVAPALLLASVVVAAPAQAGQAEICYSEIVPIGQGSAPTNDTVFNCPTQGQRTLPELATLGWSVVQMATVSTGGSGLNTTQAVQLVIQKP